MEDDNWWSPADLNGFIVSLFLSPLPSFLVIGHLTNAGGPKCLRESKKNKKTSG